MRVFNQYLKAANRMASVVLVYSACTIFGNASAACAEQASVERLNPGSYLRPGKPGIIFSQPNIANTGFIIGDTCIAVIDSGGSPAEGEALSCAVQSVSELPVCYVINTHVHPDHVMGNGAFNKQGVEFVGHKNLRRALSLLADTYIERAKEVDPDVIVEVVTPDIEVEQEITLDLGNRLLKLIPVMQSHTDNDLMVIDTQSKTLWGGDVLFSGHVPVLGGSGSINGWVELLSQLDVKGVSSIVPGHGPMEAVDGDMVELQRQYLLDLRDETRLAIERGVDIGPAVETIGQANRGSWLMFDHFHKRNVSYAFTELEWE